MLAWSYYLHYTMLSNIMLHWPVRAQFVRRFKRLTILCSIWKIGETVSLLRRTEAATIHNPVPQLSVGLLQIIVHDDLIVGTRLLGELKLVNGLVQALAQTVYNLERTRLAHELTYRFLQCF
jgi:hypothetical protein